MTNKSTDQSPATRSRGFTGLIGALALVAALSAALPYLHARRTRPGEPTSVTTLYRHELGDVQYFPFVAALARGEFHEFSIKEAVGSRILSFPYAPLLLHAGSFRLLGPSNGFFVAEVLVTVAFYLVLVAYFRTAGISPTSSAMFALLPACHLTPVVKVGLGYPASELIAPLWGERFPRPFVSEVFVLGAFVALARIVVQEQRQRSWPSWVAFGSVVALVAQSDIHSVTSLAGAASLVLAVAARRSPRQACRDGLVALAAFTLLCTPFLIQRLVEHPDLPRRFGTFPVSRLRPSFDLEEMIKAVPCLGVLASVFLLTRTLRSEIDRIKGDGWAKSLERLWLLLGVVVILAHVAMPFFTIVLGKAIQLYHFPIRSRMFRSYVMVLCLAWGLEQLYLAFLKNTTPPRRSLVALTMVVYVANILAIIWPRGAGYEGHLRPEVLLKPDQQVSSEEGNPSTRVPSKQEHGDERPYRAEFADLARHLSNLADNQRPVLATLDPSLDHWWLTFTGGYSFLADPFVAAISDLEAEQRLAIYCKLLGLTPEGYESLIKVRWVHWYWLGTHKYQASRAYAFAPLEEYEPEVQREILTGSIYNNWNTVLPTSEVERLKRDFLAMTPADEDRWQLDIIVLTSYGPLAGTEPPAKSWRKSCESPRFRVYVRK